MLAVRLRTAQKYTRIGSYLLRSPKSQMVGSYHRLKVSPIARSGCDSDSDRDRDSDSDHDSSSSTCNHVDDDSANLNLFHANRQISKEAMEVYYSHRCGDC